MIRAKKKSNLKKRMQKVIIVLLIPSLFLSFLLTIPLGYAFYNSLRDYNLKFGTNKFILFENYKELFLDTNFIYSIGRNLIYTTLVVIASFLIGLAMALLIDIKFKGSGIIYGIVLLPMLLIPSAAGTIWKFVYHPSFGIINHIIKFFGFKGSAWLSLPDTALFAVIITDIWAWTPWMFLVLLSGLQNLPEEPLESAKIDGASSLQLFRYITFPLLKPVIFIAITLKWIATSKAFDYTWVMTGGGPGGSSHLISTYIYYNSFNQLNYGYGSALSIIGGIVLLVTSVIILLIFKRKGMPL